MKMYLGFVVTKYLARKQTMNLRIGNNSNKTQVVDSQTTERNHKTKDAKT